MNKKEKALLIQKILDELFPDPPIPLSHMNDFTLLIAVLLSARTTDAQVNKVTPVLFDKAHTPEQMVKLSVDEIREIIKPCGLSPGKARNILELSKILIEKHQGKVPNTFEELEALPGIGHKCASIMMAQAFNTPAFPVDTHIHRCAQRWGLSSGKSVVQTERDLKKIFPSELWIKLHLQIIYFARAYCQARNHQKFLCPICSKIS